MRHASPPRSTERRSSAPRPGRAPQRPSRRCDAEESAKSERGLALRRAPVGKSESGKHAEISGMSCAFQELPHATIAEVQPIGLANVGRATGQGKAIRIRRDKPIEGDDNGAVF